ncbi:MAG: thrombospondin type 3 repeat-containing protein [bacterium]
MKTRLMARLILALLFLILSTTLSHAQYQNQSHETHFDTVKGPGLPDTDCLFCHDASHTLHPNVCDTCHSPFGAYNGVDDPVIGAMANWSEGVYEADGITLKSGKERWCIGCHDDVPAKSKSGENSIYAPNIAGDNTSYGFFVNGHSSGTNCLDCHNAGINHIDHESRTYTFNQAYYSPSRSGIAYAAGYRLRYIDGEVPLMIPADFGITFSYNGNLMKDTAFRLCFNCHKSLALLDDDPGDGIYTNFKSSSPKYSYGGGRDSNDHFTHIMSITGPFSDSDWDINTTSPYGMQGCDSTITCSSCHNIHGAAGTEGSTNEPMIRDGNLSGRDGYGFSYLVEDRASGGYPMVTSSNATQSNSVGAIFRNNIGTMCGASLCHVNPSPNGSSYDASGSGPGTYLEFYKVPRGLCRKCHLGEPKPGDASHLTHFNIEVMDIACSTCHGSENPHSSHLFGDGKSLEETEVCDTCHSPGGTYDGVNDALYGAKANWERGVYVNYTLSPGRDKWCAGCHDEEPSIINSVTASNIIGDEDAITNYGIGYGYYKTGHGLNPTKNYPASGGTIPGAGMMCTECHDNTKIHIDGYFRTYDSSAIDGASNDYQSGYRLKSVYQKLPLNIPREPALNTGEPANPEDFALCMKCHKSTLFLNNDSTDTNFRSTNIAYKDPSIKNAHYYHLSSWDSLNTTVYDSDWKNGSIWDSRLSCPTCHNVHGSSQLSMIRDGKLIEKEPGIRIAYYNETVSFDGACLNDPIPMNVTLNESTGTMFEPDSPSFSNICSGCHGGCWDTPLHSPYLRTPSHYAAFNDADGDGIKDNADNCPVNINPGQEDFDGDGLGDVCDICPKVFDNVNIPNPDADNDGIGDNCDVCPNDISNDVDGDGICGEVDVCPNDYYNDTQDNDGICGDIDNCPDDANADQTDSDQDGLGDVCDDSHYTLTTKRAKVCWHHDDLHVEGRFYIPESICLDALSPVGSAKITLGEFEVSNQCVRFEIKGKKNDKWEYKDKDNLNGTIKEFKIDMKGGNFDYRGDDKFHIHTHFIAGTSTIFCIHTGNVSGAFTVAINGTTIEYDENRNITTDLGYEFQKEGNTHVHYVLPFQLTSDMTIEITGAVMLNINVIDYYKEGSPEFKLVSDFDPGLFPEGTESSPDELKFVISLGDETLMVSWSDLIGVNEAWTKKDDNHWEYKW